MCAWCAPASCLVRAPFAGQSRQLQVVVVGEEQRRAGRQRRLKRANSSFRYRLMHMHATALHDALHYPDTASWYVASRALEACSNTRLLGVLLGTRSCSTINARSAWKHLSMAESTTSRHLSHSIVIVSPLRRFRPPRSHIGYLSNAPLMV